MNKKERKSKVKQLKEKKNNLKLKLKGISVRNPRYIDVKKQIEDLNQKLTAVQAA